MEDYNLNEEYKSGSEGTEDGNMEIRSEDEKKISILIMKY